MECGYHGSPFRWNEARHFLLCCELDAAYFHLYGIEREDVAYIMNTFPIVHRKVEAAYGEYRTKRVILVIYDEMVAAMANQTSYQIRLDPPPAHPDAAHPWDEENLGPELPREEWWTEKWNADDADGAQVHADKERGVVREPRVEYKTDKEDKNQDKRQRQSAPAESGNQRHQRSIPRSIQTPLINTEFTPPKGSYSQRLKRVMALGSSEKQAEMAELVAALGDENDNIRWLAGSSVTRLGGQMVVGLLAAYLETDPGETARSEAVKVLGLIAETDKDESVREVARRASRQKYNYMT